MLNKKQHFQFKLYYHEWNLMVSLEILSFVFHFIRFTTDGSLGLVTQMRVHKYNIITHTQKSNYYIKTLWRPKNACTTIKGKQILELEKETTYPLYPEAEEWIWSRPLQKRNSGHLLLKQIWFGVLSGEQDWHYEIQPRNLEIGGNKQKLWSIFYL